MNKVILFFSLIVVSGGLNAMVGRTAARVVSKLKIFEPSRQLRTAPVLGRQPRLTTQVGAIAGIQPYIQQRELHTSRPASGMWETFKEYVARRQAEQLYASRAQKFEMLTDFLNPLRGIYVQQNELKKIIESVDSATLNAPIYEQVAPNEWQSTNVTWLKYLIRETKNQHPWGVNGFYAAGSNIEYQREIINALLKKGVSPIFDNSNQQGVKTYSGYKGTPISIALKHEFGSNINLGAIQALFEAGVRSEVTIETLQELAYLAKKNINTHYLYRWEFNALHETIKLGGGYTKQTYEDIPYKKSVPRQETKKINQITVYSVLGIPESASDAEILDLSADQLGNKNELRKAYLKRVLEWHPDKSIELFEQEKFKNLTAEQKKQLADEVFKLINNTYERNK